MAILIDQYGVEVNTDDLVELDNTIGIEPEDADALCDLDTWEFENLHGHVFVKYEDTVEVFRPFVPPLEDGIEDYLPRSGGIASLGELRYVGAILMRWNEIDGFYHA
jgi:hypothetical protein